MSFRFANAVVATVLLIAAPALAQDAKPADPAAPAAPAAAAPAAQAPAAPANSGPNVASIQPEWVKLCGPDPATKKDICQTSRDLRAETGQTLASVAVREEKGGKRMLIMAIPPGMQIQPGIRIVIDEGKPVAGRYSVCFPNVCLVEAEVTDALIASMKKGQKLNLQALNVQARGVVFPVGLDGFGKSYDGDPIDPKKFQDEQTSLNEQLKKRAEEARKQLDAAQPPKQ